MAGIGFLAVIAMLAGRGFNARRGSTLDAPITAIAQPGLDGRGPGGSDPTAADPIDGGASAPFAGAAAGSADVTGGSGGSGMRGPDISKMSSQEKADRLYNRVMLATEQGNSQQAQFFAQMAMQQYDALHEEQGGVYSTDQRYHLGRIAESVGAPAVTRAEADTILQKSPDNLLGLMLAVGVARVTGNATARAEYQKKLLAVAPREQAKKTADYGQHSADITRALADAKAGK